MNLVNLGNLSAGLTVATDRHGYQHVLAVVKVTFTIGDDGKCAIAKEQQSITYADEYYGEPGLSSVRYESDFALHKPATDVVVNGTAYAPGGEPARVVDVSLTVSTIRKTIRVFGDRTWEAGHTGGFTPSPPKPFLKMPLIYERAFGGPDRCQGQAGTETANPVGIGFHAHSHKGIEGSRLPNLEHPAFLIHSPLDTPLPVGFGFMARNSRPRCSYAGTYDQAWLDNRFPFLPLDFDDRYFQGAPEDQVCPYLRGGERVRLTSLTPEGLLEFALPRPEVFADVLHANSEQEESLNPVMDTVILEPDQRRCILTWRASTRLKGKPTNIREVWVGIPGVRIAPKEMERVA